eukprot:TRINITY_DN26078_c0_g1_i1.p1 TRINITY_DN26078_c0_g1~~TRINITY_DN26078_c0_g1_i1.p1  ORF type:complete len:764 (+),score=123.18 TRINITY_DN26078_c0_g1_i1:68-2359(+)
MRLPRFRNNAPPRIVTAAAAAFADIGREIGDGAAAELMSPLPLSPTRPRSPRRRSGDERERAEAASGAEPTPPLEIVAPGADRSPTRGPAAATGWKRPRPKKNGATSREASPRETGAAGVQSLQFRNLSCQGVATSPRTSDSSRSPSITVRSSAANSPRYDTAPSVLQISSLSHQNAEESPRTCISPVTSSGGGPKRRFSAPNAMCPQQVIKLEPLSPSLASSAMRRRHSVQHSEAEYARLSEVDEEPDCTFRRAVSDSTGVSNMSSFPRMVSDDSKVHPFSRMVSDDLNGLMFPLRGSSSTHDASPPSYPLSPMRPGRGSGVMAIRKPHRLPDSNQGEPLFFPPVDKRTDPDDRAKDREEADALRLVTWSPVPGGSTWEPKSDDSDLDSDSASVSRSSTKETVPADDSSRTSSKARAEEVHLSQLKNAWEALNKVDRSRSTVHTPLQALLKQRVEPKIQDIAEAIQLTEDVQKLGIQGCEALVHVLVSKFGSLNDAFKWFDIFDSGSLTRVAFDTGLMLLHIDADDLCKSSKQELFGELHERRAKRLSRGAKEISKERWDARLAPLEAEVSALASPEALAERALAKVAEAEERRDAILSKEASDAAKAAYEAEAMAVRRGSAARPAAAVADELQPRLQPPREQEPVSPKAERFLSGDGVKAGCSTFLDNYTSLKGSFRRCDVEKLAAAVNEAYSRSLGSSMQTKDYYQKIVVAFDETLETQSDAGMSCKNGIQSNMFHLFLGRVARCMGWSLARLVLDVSEC